MRTEIVVLGAGIVGTSTALQLALRGRSVMLIDRRPPGEETSYGNAGVIECSSLVPTAFPRRVADLGRLVLGRNPAAHYQWAALPGLAPWLFAYWRASSPAGILDYARAMRPLLAESVKEHRGLAALSEAEHYFRGGGWLKLYRTEAGLAEARRETAFLNDHGFDVREVANEEAAELEPNLAPVFRGAMLAADPHSVSSPGGVVKAYAAAFEARGGIFANGDARSLDRRPGGWSIETHGGRVEAESVVVALGPWALDVLAPLGLRLPLTVKRGYHMHYAVRDGAALSRPVLDEEGGYVITSMERGVRLTTGVEFAGRDAPKSPVLLNRTEPIARGLFPLGDRLDPEPWMGSRPAFPDMRPVIGPAPGQRGLWLALGHQHLGFTLGPVTGRLLAEMMAGGETFMDATPFSAARWGGPRPHNY